MYSALLVLGFLAVLVGCANDAKEVAKLYVKAYEILSVGVTREDPGERLALYKRALNRLETIISEYPATDLATELINGEATIGGWSVSELRIVIIPRTERMANLFADLREMGDGITQLEKEIEEIAAREQANSK